ncbi:MAG: hypothetical protein KDA46_13855 [Parvularculaceae bacterium]|nr:hypothetical protein [Parvularculaceae bacterium]
MIDREAIIGENEAVRLIACRTAAGKWTIVALQPAPPRDDYLPAGENDAFAALKREMKIVESDEERELIRRRWTSKP